MGSTGNGGPELESNEIEKSKASEILTQNSSREPLSPDNRKLCSETLVIELADQTKLAGGKKEEINIVSTEEISIGKETRPSPVVTLQNCSEEKREPLLENVNTLSIPENMELPSYDGPTDAMSLDIPAACASVSPAHGELEPRSNGLGHLENEDNRIDAQLRNNKAKSKSVVTSSWILRSKSQEKLRVLEPDLAVKEGADEEKKRRVRKKKQMNKGSVSEFSRTKTHLRYLLQRIKYDQNLIDAYSAEGWKRQSVEKLKPEKELQHAKSHIMRYKLRIRELFRHLDLSLAMGKLPESLFDSVGEIDSEDIFCAKCGSRDVSLDNDIILCDGTCERGFHQFCLEPPLLKAEIPPDDVGWLCPGCDCKVDCIDMLKDFTGANLDIDDGWEKIFPEAVVTGKKLDVGYGSSDDSQDDDFDPDKLQTVKIQEEDESTSDESSYFSASDGLAAAPDKDNYLELPSDDSADNDFDPTAPYQDEPVKQSSSSSDFTSDSEDLGALLDDATMTDKDPEHISPSSGCKLPFDVAEEENAAVGKMKGLKAELAYLLHTSDKSVCDKRHVERLDYKKLLEETYGNSSSDSSDEEFGASSDPSDEDFDDTAPPKRRRISCDKTMALSPNRTPITNSTVDKEENHEKIHRLPKPKRTRENLVDGGTNKSSAENVSSGTGTKSSAHKRLGEAVTQRLYQSFNENQYPKRDVKENLAKELGVTLQQVSKWFGNARWSHNHRPHMESNTPEKLHESQAPIVTENAPFNQVTPQTRYLGAGVETLVTNTNGENSGIGKSRKGKVKKDPATASTCAIKQNMQVDAPSPQLVTSKRQTRNSKHIT